MVEFLVGNMTALLARVRLLKLVVEQSTKPLFKEIVALVIDNNERWEVLDLNLPYGFHT